MLNCKILLKKDDLDYNSFGKYLLPIAFIMKDIYHYKMLIISKVILLLRNFEKAKKNTWKSFLYNLLLLLLLVVVVRVLLSLLLLLLLLLFFSAREKVLNRFKSRSFPVKNLDKIPICEPTPGRTEPTKATKTKAKTICKIYPLKLCK